MLNEEDINNDENISCVYTLSESLIKPLEKFKILMKIVKNDVIHDLRIFNSTYICDIITEQ